ncbi:MAG TPA: hypothetical protein VK119_06750 [Bacillota bacterium]|nr:hypothetical protein [Bacillota bacterium]
MDRLRKVIHNTGTGQEEANQLVEAAHQFCPYSKAITGNIDITIQSQVES